MASTSARPVEGPVGRSCFIGAIMVTVNQLRAGVDGTRGQGGVEWPAAVWERLWGVLTRREQEVVFHHLVENRTHTEVAELLGVRRETVNVAWRRALTRIRGVITSP
ncbi:hypothetical protein R5W23_000853 [Gemmata sp. JC673]|uniref:RNA polymerase sigma-70 region 4 domain-containing protein n=1 Tax=Gemmata algarum TaxID=2975278 RepID=A0ABU5EU25_9BACT|nr:sigma factor-like helix-turn-helix DNA-binding protein [Gemmata algarum]MDY3558132.1 hypothetical protein [Gemmata algarum]